MRAEERKMHARVLAMLQAPGLKTWREFRQSCHETKGVTYLICFPNFTSKQHFNIIDHGQAGAYIPLKL